MCVTVPVAPSSRSPLTKVTPTASPGFSGPSNSAMPARPAPAAAPIGRKPALRKVEASTSPILASKPDMTSGVAIGLSMVPISPPKPLTLDTPTSCASLGRSANGRFQFSALRNDASRPSEVMGRPTSTRAPGGRGAFEVVASVISAIGVMPAIGSFEKLPREYDTAPMSLPSM